MTLRSAEAHYAERAALAETVRRRVRVLFRADLDSWQRLVPAVTGLVSVGQLRAAVPAEAYVGAALEEQGGPVEGVATVVPRAFAGVASDGRPLRSLMDQPRIEALTAIRDGAGVAGAVTSARSRLEMLAVTQVQDAGRQADSVAIFARPRVGWVRMVNLPCCSRCAVLAGKWFRSNQGFQRHPRCDCTHIPAPEDVAGDVGTDPGALFRSGQVKGLSEAETKAIADGADPAQVVNARRGSDGMFTTEGTTRRGVAGSRMAPRSRRPTPDAIYANATDRDDALALLKANGFIR